MSDNILESMIAGSVEVSEGTDTGALTGSNNVDLLSSLITYFYNNSLVSQVCGIQPTVRPAGKIASLIGSYDADSSYDNSQILRMAGGAFAVDDAITDGSATGTVTYVEDNLIIVKLTGAFDKFTTASVISTQAVTEVYSTRLGAKQLFTDYVASSDYSDINGAKLNVIASDYQAKTYKVKTSISPEAIQDFGSLYSDSTTVTSTILGTELSDEISNLLIDTLIANSNAKGALTLKGGANYEDFKDILFNVNKHLADISAAYGKALKGYAIVGSKVAGSIMNELDRKDNIHSMYLGSKGTVDYYQSSYLAPEDVIVGIRGKTTLDESIKYIPFKTSITDMVTEHGQKNTFVMNRFDIVVSPEQRPETKLFTSFTVDYTNTTTF